MFVAIKYYFVMWYNEMGCSTCNQQIKNVIFSNLYKKFNKLINKIYIKLTFSACLFIYLFIYNAFKKYI